MQGRGGGPAWGWSREPGPARALSPARGQGSPRWPACPGVHVQRLRGTGITSLSETLGRLRLHPEDPCLHPLLRAPFRTPRSPAARLGPWHQRLRVCSLYLLESGRTDNRLFVACTEHKQETSAQPWPCRQRGAHLTGRPGGQGGTRPDRLSQN